MDPKHAPVHTHATIVLAEPAGVVCAAVRRVLEADPEFAVVAEALDLDMAARKVLGYKPDVAVIDENIGGGSLYEVLPQIASASPRTGVILLTDDDDPHFVRSFMRAGGRGMVLKRAPSGHLTDAVRAVAHGRSYLDPGVGARLAIEPEALNPYADELTEREVEVMKLVALGYTTPEIADRLTLSVRTVEARRAHLKRKIHTRSRAGVIAYARACHMV
jgi:two-component system response regulator NreC